MDTDIKQASGIAMTDQQQQEHRQEMSSASTLETDLEGRGNQGEKLETIDLDGGDHDGGDIVRPASKDFPDLAPSKSMEFPDGGRAAWLTVSGGFLCLFCSFGFINAVGVFQTYYQQNQLSSHSAFQIGWISSFLAFFMNMGGIIVGPLFDIYGPRWLLIVGSILAVFGLMMTSICNQYWQFFLAQGVVTGAGLSLVFQVAINCINTWFLHKRGLAMGLTVAGSSLGGVCYPIMLKRLFDSVGFGWGVRAVAFLMLGCLIVANFLVRSRLAPPGWTKGRQLFDLSALKEPVFCLVVTAATFLYWGLFTPFTFLTQYGISYGMDENLAFYLISIINAASIIGRILPGFLADKVGAFNIQICFSTVMAIGLLAYWMPLTNQAGIITFALFYGFVSGAFISLFTVCLAMISPIKKIGARFGLMSAFNGIASLTGIPISGALILPGTWSNGFGPMILFSGIMASIGAAFYIAARVKMVGWKLNVKR